MKKQDRGAVLTSVILMVLVMTLIGVPLIGMVVYNYRLREMDNSLRRAEYENEMAMDKIYLVIRENVIQAIEYAKSNATEAVNATSELQRTQYSSIRARYEDLWIKTSDNSAGNINTMIQSGALGILSDEIKVQLTSKTLDEAKEIYVKYKVESELSTLNDDALSDDILDPLYVGSLLNPEDGTLNDVQLKNAYNNVFRYYYQMYIKEDIIDQENSNVLTQIKTKGNYTHILDADRIITKGSEPPAGSYLKIDAEISDPDWTDDRVDIDVDVAFRKNSKTMPSALAATFVVDTPEFDSVTNIEQHTVALSNPLTAQGVTVGGTLEIASGTIVKMANDMTISTYDEWRNEDVDKGIILEEDAQLLALEGNSISNSRIAVNGDIVMKKGTTLSSGKNPLYYRNLYVGERTESGGAYTIYFNGNVVAKDDLEINTDGKVDIQQDKDSNYYGYNDSNDEGPDSSSSIVVNSGVLTNKTLRLGNLYLAGRAFIEGAISTRRNMVEGKTGEEDYILDDVTGEYIKVPKGTGTHRNEDLVYKTGESIAVKGNYIAYQTLLSDSEEKRYTPDKVKYSTYFIANKTKADEYDKSEVPISLADALIDDLNNEDLDDEEAYEKFDNDHKYKYFLQYAEDYKSVFQKLDVTSEDIKYMEGAGFQYGVVTGPRKSLNQAYKTNLGNEYEKYTQYFGYRPVDEDGKVDTSKAKTRIFGNNGWIKTNSSLRPKESGADDYRYCLIYDMNNENTRLELDGKETGGIIICKGNLEIYLSEDTTFSGMIVVGGTLKISGGKTLTLTDSKESTIQTIIGNYLEKPDFVEATGEDGELYQVFEYDGSGTTYVVTEVNDTFINVNELINITNWRKQDVGRL